MCQENHRTVPSAASWQHPINDSLPGIVWSTDRDLRLTSCAGEGVARGGLHAHDILGTKLADLLKIKAGDDPVLTAHHEALAGRECMVTLELGDRKYRGVVVPIRAAGRIVGTALNVLEQPIVDSRCQSIADASLEVILFLRPDGTIVDVNRTAGRIEPRQVVDKSVFDFAPPDQRDALRKAMASVVESGEPATIDLRFPNSVGQVKWQALRIGPWRVRDRVIGLVILAADVTQRRMVVQKLLDEEKLLRQMLDLQERERRLVAYEIHDGFIQDVIAVRMMLEAMHDQLDPTQVDLRTRLSTAVGMLGNAIGEGRRLISELRPMIIDEMGLVEAIQFLVEEEQARDETEIHFTPRVGFERLPPLLQATVFRIVREAITNARRHGHAQQIEIRLTDVADNLVIEVRDDGRGFDPDAVPHSRYGLEGIRERAKLFGGGATIESKPGKGTRITVKLPTALPDSARMIQTDNWCWTV